MEKTIFLPDEQQHAQLMSNAWLEFCEEMKKKGIAFDDSPTAKRFAFDFFVSGYCYGYNDLLRIVRGQLEIINMEFSDGKEEVAEGS